MDSMLKCVLDSKDEAERGRLLDVLLDWGKQPDVWLPMMMQPQALPASGNIDLLNNRDAIWLMAVAAPEWVSANVPTEWVDRYGKRVDDTRRNCSRLHAPRGREGVSSRLKFCVLTKSQMVLTSRERVVQSVIGLKTLTTR